VLPAANALRMRQVMAKLGLRAARWIGDRRQSQPRALASPVEWRDHDGRFWPRCVIPDYVKFPYRFQTWPALAQSGSSHRLRTSRNPHTAPAAREREVVRSVRGTASSCPRGPLRSLCWLGRGRQTSSRFLTVAATFLDNYRFPETRRTM
jgi:hypothetical protein